MNQVSNCLVEYGQALHALCFQLIFAGLGRRGRHGRKHVGSNGSGRRALLGSAVFCLSGKQTPFILLPVLSPLPVTVYDILFELGFHNVAHFSAFPVGISDLNAF